MQNILANLSNIDSHMLYAVQSIGVQWLTVAKFVSYGFGYPAMVLVFALTLFLMRKHRIAFELLVIAFLSLAVTYVLKVVFHANRPYMVDPHVIKYDSDSGWGMPSAHALMSIVILGWIVIRHPRSHILLWGSIALALLIGLSRVYLGVHYPSQVLAGWFFGFILLYVFRSIDKKLWSPFQKKLS